MAIEIERKFLVKGDDWKKMGRPVRYRQGYIFSEQGKNVRVRTCGKKAYLTIKKRQSRLTRLEFEYEIPVEDAESLLHEVCRDGLIEKYRRKIKIDDLIWEVDEFLGENEGLILAEVELSSEEQQVVLPSWIGMEVSNDPRYYNAYLAKRPFKTWHS